MLARRSPSRRVGTVLALLVAVVTLPACSGAASTDSPTPAVASSPASPSPTAATSARAAPGGGDRPLQAVPGVRPAGFTDPPPGNGVSRYTGQRLDWDRCRQQLRCATVTAPLDWEVPDGTAVTLSLAKRPATRPRLGTLFINPGGPGGSGVSYVDYFDRAGLEAYDIVGWDPRGVGESTPVGCFGGRDLDQYYAVDVSPDGAAERRTRLREERELGTSCLQRSGPLLQHVSTAETVRDLDLLRSLVGDERLSYFGSSYGTQIGALYAELFPERVGRLVLDGAVNITEDRSMTQIEGFERALNHFAAWCAERSCRLGADEDAVLRRVRQFLERLDEQPLRVGDRTLSQQQGVSSVVYPLYGGEDGWRALEAGLTAAIERGDGRVLLGIADSGVERREDGSYGQAAYAFPAVRCLDLPDSDLAEADRRWRATWTDAPVLGPLAGANLTCPSWPVAPAPEVPRIDGAGAPPVVVIGTTGDPATPYEFAEGMAEQLESGVLVTLDGEGHLAYGQSPCVRDLVRRYLVDDQVPTDGTRC